MSTVSIKKPWYKRFTISDRAKEIIVYIIGLLCMFLFVFSAAGKVMEHKRFYDGLHIVPVIGPYAAFISWGVPVSEIVVSGLLLLPSTQKKGLYAFTALMIVFTIYIICMLIRGGDLPCSCNIIVEKLTWPQHVAFNMFFIIIAVYALWPKKSIHKI